MMKLRIRSLESKETQKIEVPDPCSLQHFKNIISQRLSSSSPSLHLSLNGKQELQASSEQSLRSLGITSCDLIYYTFDPLAFSPPPQSPIPSQTLGSQPLQTLETTHPPDSYSREERKVESMIQDHGVQFKDSELLETESSESDLGMEISEGGRENQLDFNQRDGKIPDCDTQEGETLNHAGAEDMEVESGSDDLQAEGFSVPNFLRNVLIEEVIDDGDDLGLLLSSVHAVLLESGFVGYDRVSGVALEGSRLLHDWHSRGTPLSFCYSLPELVARGSGIEIIAVKFQNLGKFMNVFGSVSKSGSNVYRVCLDVNRFAPLALGYVRRNLNPSDVVNSVIAAHGATSEREIFDFWRIIKDGLVLPLMIDICEMSGLGYPPCLMRLPTELKFKILECLPGNAIAKMELVCSDFRYLSANNDLWKRKYVEEYGTRSLPENHRTPWKARYAQRRQEAAKLRAMADDIASRARYSRPMRPVRPMRPLLPYSPFGPDRYRFPFIHGGRFGPSFIQHRDLQNMLPPCYLGEGEYESEL